MMLGAARTDATHRERSRILLRAMRYVGNHRWIAFLAYGSLVVATGAQLMVPQLVQSIIDTVVKAFAASQILGLPANAQSLAAQKMGETTAQLQSRSVGCAGGAHYD